MAAILQYLAFCPGGFALVCAPSTYIRESFPSGVSQREYPASYAR
ncbi:unnamed protein product [Rhodiola kirilowii]